MNDQKVQLVVAPNYRTFCLWCAENGYHPGSKMVRFISKPMDLRGYRDGNRHELVMVSYCIHPSNSHREMMNRAMVMQEVRMLEQITDIEVRHESV